VLNKDTGNLFSPVGLIWIEGAREAVKAINDAGHLAFVVTNQSGIARGLFGESDVQKLHARMAEELATSGAHIDRFGYCPHRAVSKSLPATQTRPWDDHRSGRPV